MTVSPTATCEAAPAKYHMHPKMWPRKPRAKTNFIDSSTRTVGSGGGGGGRVRVKAALLVVGRLQDLDSTMGGE